MPFLGHFWLFWAILATTRPEPSGADEAVSVAGAYRRFGDEVDDRGAQISRLDRFWPILAKTQFWTFWRNVDFGSEVNFWTPGHLLGSLLGLRSRGRGRAAGAGGLVQLAGLSVCLFEHVEA